MSQEDVFTPEPAGVLDDYDYEQAIEHGLGAFARSAPEAALPLAIRLLDDALALSERPTLVERREDFSPMWRPSIAHATRHGQSHARASALIDVVRDAATAIARNDPTRVPELVRTLEERRWPVFRRIALHLLHEVPDPALIRDRILNPAELAQSLPEYDRLIRAHFPHLTEGEREQYTRLVEERPARLTYSSGEPVEPDEAASWLAAWRLRRLRAIAEHLPPSVRSRYPDLDRTAQPPTEDIEEIESGWISEPAKIDAEGFAAMPMPEILAHLRTWKPTGEFMGPTIRSQGDALQAATKNDPTRFGGHASEFRGLDPTYVRSLVSGLTDTVKTGTAIAWAPVLELAVWVLDQPDLELPNAWERDPGWSWTRRQIADLIGEGLREGPAQVPIELRERIWPLLETLAEDDAESSVWEEGREPDPVMATLNSNRGAALQAVVTYLDWVRRHSRDPRAPAMELAAEAEAVLRRHAEPTEDSSVATRGTLGMRLVNLVALDEGWARAHRALLFPYESAPRLAKWTWDAYISVNRPFTQLLNLFLEDYAKAIERIPGTRPEGHLEADRHLAEHLVIFYLWGRLDLDNPRGLLRQFYGKSPTWIRAHGMEFAGRVMKDSPLDDEQCQRLQRLWTYRREAIGSQREEHAELVEFGWWFIAEHCDSAWRLLELVRAIELTGTIEPDSLVLEKLATIAPESPVEALRAAELLIATPKERWFVSAGLPEIEAILRATLASNTTREPATALVNRLVADGYVGLADLLRVGGGDPSRS